MTDSLIQAVSETKILSYKLDKIRNYILNRLEVVDPIAKNELKVILNFISNYEHVPADWTLINPLVNMPTSEGGNDENVK